MKRPSPGDTLREIAEFIEQVAELSTYEEVIAMAKGDPDLEQVLREDYMQELEDDYSNIIWRARRLWME